MIPKMSHTIGVFVQRIRVLRVLKVSKLETVIELPRVLRVLKVLRAAQGEGHCFSKLSKPSKLVLRLLIFLQSKKKCPHPLHFELKLTDFWCGVYDRFLATCMTHTTDNTLPKSLQQMKQSFAILRHPFS